MSIPLELHQHGSKAKLMTASDGVHSSRMTVKTSIHPNTLRQKDPSLKTCETRSFHIQSLSLWRLQEVTGLQKRCSPALLVTFEKPFKLSKVKLCAMHASQN